MDTTTINELINKLTLVNDAPEFNLDSFESYMKVINIHDGDTIKVITEIPGFGLRTLNIRLAMIDTPEINSNIELERKYAMKALNRLKELLKDIVYVKILTADMYGRYLGVIYYSHLCEGDSINNILVKEHLAYPYLNGRVKRTPFNVLHEWYLTDDE